MPGILGKHINPDKGIKEDIHEGYLEFYVAGYTKQCKGVNVQANHSMLYSDAAYLCRNVDLDDLRIDRQLTWPFGYKSHEIARIDLIPEPDNKYDSNAIIVAAECPFNIAEFERGNHIARTLLYLGYVPASINRIIKDKMHRLQPGWVKKTRLLLRKPHNHCTTKVAIPWSPDVGAEDEAWLARIDSIVKNW